MLRYFADHWRGWLLAMREGIVRLINNTTLREVFKICAELDQYLKSMDLEISGANWPAFTPC